MSRLRENPEKLFEVFLEVGKPVSDKEAPFILQKYPPDYNEEEVLKSVPKFAFPCDTERYTTTVDHFTFTLTDLDSKFKFGFCRHATGAQTCFCIVSFLPWFEVFYNFLNILAEVTNRSDDCDIKNMLRAAYAHDVPSSGVPVTIVAGQEMFSFKAPETNKLPSIPNSRNLTEYYNAVDTDNMMVIFASMLHERRVLVTSKKLSRVTAVIHAAANLLYPMFWQHLFIPVLPSFLIDYLSAPMPYVIGVHAKLMEKVNLGELGDAVVVDADKNTVSTEYDDLHDLPEDMEYYLKRHLKSEKVKNSMQSTGDIISKTFMMSLVKLIGGYRDALMFHEGETITFNPEAFVQSRPLSMQPFLQKMLHLQIFQQFINERLDMLNEGRGFTDIFEQECLVHADKLNAQTRYNEWLGKMKKQGKKLHRGGKDVWSDFKDKAGPAMSSAMESVKIQGKKAYSKAKNKLSDMKKEEDGTPKQPKIRPGNKTKSFSKEKPAGIIKDRPTTISGGVLKLERPPRPGVPPREHVERPRPMTAPRQLLVRQPSSDRPGRSHHDEKRVSSDDSDLVMNRVSINLMADPDIQNAMFKSASAEHLAKPNRTLQASSSSGTITSTSSYENDLEQRTSILYMDDDVPDGPHSRGDHSNMNYTNLLNDDDSGIVMRTDSQLSLDKSKPDSSGAHFSNPNLHASKSDSRLPPPRPAPRKSTGGSATALSESNLSRERPAPVQRKQLIDSSLPKPCGDILIDFGQKSLDSDKLANELDELSLQSSGDYVLLKEPVTPKFGENNGGNRRSSISRTPVIKYGQNETPKRPSIRRERSPITPDELPEKSNSLLDFDPLLNTSNEQTVTQSSEVKAFYDNDDSLLKDWDIGGLVNLQQNLTQNQSNFTPNQSTNPVPPPRHRTHPIRHPNVSTDFFSPQPFMTGARATFSPVGFQNPGSLPAKIAPKPKPRTSTSELGARTQLFPTQADGTETGNQSDPFADLVNLNQPAQQRTSANWETFN